MTQIVDFSWGRPSVASLLAADVSVVVRYLTRDRTGKALTSTEAAAYRAAKIKVVGVFQDTANRALGGFAAGQADGEYALAQAQACGFPGVGAIYFAADFDVKAQHLDAVEQYFRGVGTRVLLDNVGIYGDYDAMERIYDRDLATYYWQAGASSWSSGRQFPQAHMLQKVGGPTIGGASVDYNQRLAADVGEWGGTGMAAADNPNQNRADVEAELDEATAKGYRDFDDMFQNEDGGIVALLRAIYNGVGLNRGINVADQVGLVGLAVSKVGSDLLALSSAMQSQLNRMEQNQLKILSGIAALSSGGTPLPDPAVDPHAFADAFIAALVERLSGGLVPRALLTPMEAHEATPTPSDTPLGDAAALHTLGEEPRGGWGQT